MIHGQLSLPSDNLSALKSSSSDRDTDATYDQLQDIVESPWVSQTCLCFGLEQLGPLRLLPGLPKFYFDLLAQAGD